MKLGHNSVQNVWVLSYKSVAGTAVIEDDKCAIDRVCKSPTPLQNPFVRKFLCETDVVLSKRHALFNNIFDIFVEEAEFSF